jgi:hypothetical protein
MDEEWRKEKLENDENGSQDIDILGTSMVLGLVKLTQRAGVLPI